MSKLWQKSNTPSLHPAIEKYTAGTDYIFDLELFPFDIEASKAQASMLTSIEIITEEENIRLQNALTTLLQKWENNEIQILPKDEDCHTVIENFLIETCGDAGKKIHTGRSRNDQVLVAVRLFMKSKLFVLHTKSTELANLFLEKAKQYKNIPLPGYTHTQQAMLSSVGHLFSSYHQMLEWDTKSIHRILEQIDENPLGSAAGYGVSIPLDRKKTTEELGFARLQKNSLWCQSSRGKMESFAMEGLSQIMMSLGKYASDMLFFTTQELQFFTANDSVVTGSSIMPQKRNLDGLEIVRANNSVIVAKALEVKEISKNLISGYHRDLQLIKKPLFEAFQIVFDSLEVVEIYVENLSPNQTAIEEKITKEMFLADIANDLVKTKGMAFRDAYVEAYSHLETYQIDFSKNIAEKISEGSVGNWE